MEKLTARQEQILAFIHRFSTERGYPPTIREIGDEMEIASTNGVNDHLKALERKGYVQRTELTSRSLVLTKKAHGVVGVAPTATAQAANLDPSTTDANGIPLREGLIRVPLLGKVAAGAPILADQSNHTEDSVVIDSFFLGGGGREVFALKVKGESMIEDGIFDGDFLFVRKSAQAASGDIVVALIGDEATCKRYFPEGDTIRFQPANATMVPIYVRKQDFRTTMILGVVVGVYRKVN